MIERLPEKTCWMHISMSTYAFESAKPTKINT